MIRRQTTAEWNADDHPEPREKYHRSDLPLGGCWELREGEGDEGGGFHLVHDTFDPEDARYELFTESFRVDVLAQFFDQIGIEPPPALREIEVSYGKKIKGHSER